MICAGILICLGGMSGLDIRSIKTFTASWLISLVGCEIRVIDGCIKSKKRLLSYDKIEMSSGISNEDSPIALIAHNIIVLINVKMAVGRDELPMANLVSK